ncbi:hypothetical protein [Zophobihabitans entericus]|uniref:Uncharacterized protein n=1 Tax=Zophobihabitans entericus TaxID=1635327 RepID=A0A6G9ID34_9GAMM|nr:hypothetical protein [Zophobihabitans entericus]QIQ22146.1 hypothetical protein IPMB12_10895 [Zophobihabitans entericus]
MAYQHYFYNNKPVPQDKWLHLCIYVADIYHFMQRNKIGHFGKDIEICDVQGLTPIHHVSELFTQTEGISTIAFNGNRAKQQSCEAFIFPQAASDHIHVECKTRMQPYEFMVMAALILAHNLCGDYYSIHSDSPKQEWQLVLAWINLHFDGGYTLPPIVN